MTAESAPSSKSSRMEFDSIVPFLGPLALIAFSWCWGVSGHFGFLLGSALIFSLLSLVDLRLSGVSMIICGALYLPTFGTATSALNMDHLFSITGTFAIALWILLQRRWRLAVPNSAIYLSAVLLLQLTPNFNDFSDVILAAGRTVTLLALALSLAIHTPLTRPIPTGALLTMVMPAVASPIFHAMAVLETSAYVLPEGLRYGGVMGHPNLASYAIVVILAGLATPIVSGNQRLSKRSILISSIFVLLGSWSVVLGGSIGAFATLTVVGMAVVGLGLFRALKQFFALAVVGLSFFIPYVATFFIPYVATFFTPYVATESTLQRRLEVEILTNSSTQIPLRSLQWRLDLWKELIDKVGLSNWFGLGVKSSESLSSTGFSAHSSYLQAYIDFGFVGLGVLVITVLAIVFRSKNDARELSIYFLAFTVLLAGGLTDPTLFHPVTLIALIITESLVNSNNPRLASRIATNPPKFGQSAQ